MELKNLEGYRLKEIIKRNHKNILLFRKQGSHEKIELFFDGLLFESTSPVANKKVHQVFLEDTLGFRALTELRHQNLNIREYKQLLLKMEDSTNDYKVELICVFKKHRLQRNTTA